MDPISFSPFLKTQKALQLPVFSFSRFFTSNVRDFAIVNRYSDFQMFRFFQGIHVRADMRIFRYQIGFHWLVVDQKSFRNMKKGFCWGYVKNK